LVGYRLAIGMTASRIVSLGVLSLGLSIMLADRNDQILTLDPLELDLLPRVVVFVGMLSLSGFPLTAGFPGRWSLLTNLMDTNSPLGYTVFMAYLGLSVLTIWWGYRLLHSGFQIVWEGISAEQLFTVMGVLLILMLGIFPQLTYPWVVDLVSGLTRLFG
jgi:formate hydrogenlyase subunit 3/multisubunit Na+/H+ antiporter MnhD subunit